MRVKEMVMDIEEMWVDGASVADIAKATGMTINFVNQVIDDLENAPMEPDYDYCEGC
jgi:hypothetical protein